MFKKYFNSFKRNLFNTGNNNKNTQSNNTYSETPKKKKKKLWNLKTIINFFPNHDKINYAA